MEEMAAILRRRLGEGAAKVPRRKFPNFAVRLAALFDADLRTVTPGLAGPRILIGQGRGGSALAPRPAEETVIDCAQSLMAHGLA